MRYIKEKILVKLFLFIRIVMNIIKKKINRMFDTIIILKSA